MPGDVKAIKCPCCGANVKIADVNKYFECGYCGATLSPYEISNIESISSYTNRITALLDAGRIEDAHVVCNELIDKYPTTPIGHKWKIRCFTSNFKRTVETDVFASKIAIIEDLAGFDSAMDICRSYIRLLASDIRKEFQEEADQARSLYEVTVAKANADFDKKSDYSTALGEYHAATEVLKRDYQRKLAEYEANVRSKNSAKEIATKKAKAKHTSGIIGCALIVLLTLGVTAFLGFATYAVWSLRVKSFVFGFFAFPAGFLTMAGIFLTIGAISDLIDKIRKGFKVEGNFDPGYKPELKDRMTDSEFIEDYMRKIRTRRDDIISNAKTNYSNKVTELRKDYLAKVHSEIKHYFGDNAYKKFMSRDESYVMEFDLDIKKA